MTERLPNTGRPTGIAAQLDWLFAGRILGPLRTSLGSVIITAGPWLVFVVGLAIISISMQPVLGRDGIEDLRLTVVYAFIIAPIVAGPIGVVAARTIRHAMEENEGAMVSEIFVVAAAASGIASQFLATLMCFALGIEPLGVAIAFVFLSVSAALLWISFAVLGALRANAFLIVAFTTGMAISVACIMLAAAFSPTIETMIWSFTTGVVACITLSMGYGRRLCGIDARDYVPAARLLVSSIRRDWHLALGVLFALTGVWMDKWVLWFGPLGSKTSAGFVHNTSYDSVIFLAHLSIIPTFAAMQVFHDTALTKTISDFRRTLRDGSTYTVIRHAVNDLEHVAWSNILRILFIQATVTASLVLMAPLLARMMDFSFLQFLVLRVGLIAVFLHSIIYLSCTILLFCGRNRIFLFVQFTFLAVNLAASLIIYSNIGVSAYPLFLSSLVVGAAAFLFALRSVARYDFLVFLQENDSLYSRTKPSRAKEIFFRLYYRIAAQLKHK